MDIDGRLDRLTERHEALAQSLELFIASSRENDKLLTDRMANLTDRMAQLMETMNRLSNIVILHEERLDSNEDRLDDIEGKS